MILSGLVADHGRGRRARVCPGLSGNDAEYVIDCGQRCGSSSLFADVAIDNLRHILVRNHQSDHNDDVGI